MSYVTVTEEKIQGYGNKIVIEHLIHQFCEFFTERNNIFCDPLIVALGLDVQELRTT